MGGTLRSRAQATDGPSPRPAADRSTSTSTADATGTTGTATTGAATTGTEKRSDRRAGPGRVHHAVRLEAHHGSGPIHAYDKLEQATRMETERPHALRQAITSCRKRRHRVRQFVITHRMPLEDAPRGYDMFKNKQDNCLTVVLSP